MNTKPWLAIVMALALVACASTPDRVVLLPGEDGKVGKIHVLTREGGQETLLENAYASAATGNGRLKAEVSAPISVREDFEGALKALPQKPTQHQLYFEGDSTTLDAESRTRLPLVLAEIARYPAPEVSVIGHTDRMGSVEYNDTLGLSRAIVVREALVAIGIDPVRISVSSRGEREPRIATADEVAEPRNRRVEVSVR
jgi:outer membrane protein OmpA-like peptidoglycan-associated protein